MTEDVRVAIEQTLYREARLIDERRFREWLDLFTDDVHYRMPLRTVRYAANSKAVVRPEGSGSLREVTAEDELAIFDEDKRSLSMRVARLETGAAWAEDPPSRTTHIVTNVEVEPRSENEVVAYSTVVVHRVRLEADEDTFFGRREDVLRRVNGDWKIARRTVVLGHGVLRARSISFFF